MKLSYLHFLLLVTLSVSVSNLFCQSHPYQHFSVADGLPSSEVYDVYQDSKGFMWFATDNGVVRYDGNDMEVFQTSEGLTDPVVFELIEDANERIWFRTYSGRISYFSNERISPYKYIDTVSSFCKNSLLQSLFIDNNDQVWLGTENFIIKIDNKGNSKIEIKNAYNEIALLEKENKILHSVRGPELHIANANGKRIQAKGIASLNYRAIVEALKWKGHLYFSHGESIYQIDGQIVKPVYRGAAQIISLSTDKGNNLWVGYRKNGVECLVDFGLKKEIHFSFADAKSVSDVIQDRSGGYWLSTLEDGIFHIPHVDFFEAKLPSKFKSHKVSAFNGKTILAENYGLVILDERGRIAQIMKLKGGAVTAIMEAPQKKLWVSTTEGTFIVDSTYKAIKILTHSFNDLSLIKDSLILGAYNTFRIKASLEGKVLEQISNLRLYRLIYSNERFIFQFGRLGLQVFNNENKEVKLPSSFDALKITKILSLNDSLLLFGTLGSGLLVVNQNKWTFEQYSSAHKFISNNIYTMIADGTSFWLGMEKGIAHASVQSIIKGNPNFSFLLMSNNRGNNKINQLVSSHANVMAFGEESFFILPKKVKQTPPPPL